jgi:hypothetical protein
MSSPSSLLSSSIRRLIDQVQPTYFQEDPNWPRLDQYYNRERHKFYKPHHAAEEQALLDTLHRYILAKGGEGGGKSVFGIIRDLERFKRGCHGIVISPDFEHFKKSLWPEFRRWCPWDMVVPRQRYRQDFDWEPTKPFSLAFVTGAIGYFGGIDKEMSWEGPNVNFAHFDECRKKDTALALKVLDGRVRIPGPLGDPPQMWLTTTPRKHWLFDYFGPLQPGDPFADFKASSLVFVLLSVENEENLEEGYARKRRQTLTEAEARVLLEAEWEDLEDVAHFLPSIALWERLGMAIPPLDAHTPVVVALDGAVTYDDFGLAVVSRHWLEHLHDTDVSIRYAESWTPPGGGQISFRGTEEMPGPELRLKQIIQDHNVIQVCYDPNQLHDMAQRLGIAGEGLAWFSEFGQQTERLVADKRFFDLVMQSRVHHNGDQTLRAHIDNADRKDDKETRRLRIVKRHEALKIDLAVASSMGAHRVLELNL